MVSGPDGDRTVVDGVSNWERLIKSPQVVCRPSKANFAVVKLASCHDLRSSDRLMLFSVPRSDLQTPPDKSSSPGNDQTWPETISLLSCMLLCSPPELGSSWHMVQCNARTVAP